MVEGVGCKFGYFIANILKFNVIYQFSPFAFCILIGILNRMSKTAKFAGRIF